MSVRVHDGVAASLEVIGALGQESTDYFSTRGWYANFAAHCLNDRDVVSVHALERDGLILGALPLQKRAQARRVRGASEVGSLSNFYSCIYRPLLRRHADTGFAAKAFARSLAAHRTGVDLFDLDSLSHEEVMFQELTEAMREAGFFVQPYFHFGNRYEDVRGLDYEAYLQRRPPALRNTLSRKAKRLVRAADATFSIAAEPADAVAAAIQYEAVYRASWKEAEPAPGFTSGLIAAAAADGALRLGICTVDGEPAAAQLWLVHGGKATIFKLAYDERFRQHSVGSLLTAHMVRAVLEQDAVDEIDFGRGDDPYKGDWLSQRRERWGILAFNARRPLGAAAALAHGTYASLRKWFPSHKNL